jgi:uncharacterized membrane protein YjgN (DUF898 family)
MLAGSLPNITKGNNMTDEQTSSPKIERFKFSGEAGEYFGIWFVNNLLMVLTLGIYSPWAKVRNLQYFYGNTHLASGSFQFTANPVTILRSRIIAVLLLVLYMVSDGLGSTLANIVLMTFVAAYFIFAPMLTVYIMSFRLRYSAWRGMAFKFNKDFKGAYRVYLAPLSLIMLFFASFYLPLNSKKAEELLGLDPYIVTSEAGTEAPVIEPEPLDEDLQLDESLQPLDEGLPYEESASESGESTAVQEEDAYLNPYLFIPAGILLLLNFLLFPYFEFISNRFLVRNSRFGSAKWRYTATAGQYYAFYAKFLLITLGFALAGAAIIMGDFGEDATAIMAVPLALLYFPAASAYTKSRRYNLVFNNIEIQGGYTLQAEIPFDRFFLLVITNSIVVILTLGLMTPWAKIRTAALMLEYTALKTPGSMDKFIAEQQNDSPALAEEIGDAFDLELGM